MRTAAAAAALTLALMIHAGRAPAAPENLHPSEARVIVKSGAVIRGRVVAGDATTPRHMQVVDTDFGRILVASREIGSRVEPALSSDATFYAAEIRVVGLEGDVQRQVGGEGKWVPISWPEADSRHDAFPVIRPGDSVRTGADGVLDLQFHRSAWVRLRANTEIGLPGAPAAKGSVLLRGGSLVSQIRGRPRGETFRVATPNAVLGVRGTAFESTVYLTEESVAVAEGVVEVEGRGEVLGGQVAVWHSSGAIRVASLTTDLTSRITVQARRAPLDDMVYVPGGTYEVGGRGELAEVQPKFVRSLLQQSCHVGRAQRVAIEPFLIDRRETYDEEYRRYFPESGGSAISNPGRPAYITWSQARHYLTAVGRALPTDVEWEAAARGRPARAWTWARPWPGVTLADLHAGDFDYDLPAQGGAGLGAGRTLRFVMRWRGPGTLPTVDTVARDVTPEGVRGLLSLGPEWCTDWFADFDARSTPAALADDPPPSAFDPDAGIHTPNYRFPTREVKVARGSFGVTVRLALETRDVASVRGVRRFAR